MFNARLLGNGRYYGNRIMADMSRRRWHPTTQVSAKSVHWWASYSISKFQHFPIWRPSAILNFKNFHIWLRDCHWVPNLLLYTKFYQIYILDYQFGHQTPIVWASGGRTGTAHTAIFRCAVAKQRPLPWQPHHGGHVREMRAPKSRPNCSTGRWAFQTFFNTAAVLHLNWNFIILDHPRSRLCCLVVLWKFGVDPILAVRDIAILWFC